MSNDSRKIPKTPPIKQELAFGLSIDEFHWARPQDAGRTAIP